MTEQAEVIVVGAGQAGLTAGYYLTQAKMPFVILHADARVGDSWRARWDSLTLFTPALYSALPGLAASLDSLRGRTQRGDTLIGTSLRALKRHHGVELVDRAADAHERTVTLRNGRELEVETVIWATGYRPDYSWIHAAVLDPQGAPTHRRGVTESPGLYFLGMKNQYSRGSSLLHWVRHDAEYIVDQVRGSRKV